MKLEDCKAGDEVVWQRRTGRIQSVGSRFVHVALECYSEPFVGVALPEWLEPIRPVDQGE